MALPDKEGINTIAGRRKGKFNRKDETGFDILPPTLKSPYHC
jgi:hypothetical protein